MRVWMLGLGHCWWLARLYDIRVAVHTNMAVFVLERTCVRAKELKNMHD